MDKKEIFNEVVNAFEQKYSWLGKQFAQEFLYVFASHILHKSLAINGERIRSHLLLFWERDWFQRNLLFKVYEILGYSNCEYMLDIINKDLKGIVTRDYERRPIFIPPRVVRAPFIICTEMGAITKGLKRVKKILLQMLKEDEVTVNLKKFVKLNKEEKKRDREVIWNQV